MQRRGRVFFFTLSSAVVACGGAGGPGGGEPSSASVGTFPPSAEIPADAGSPPAPSYGSDRSGGSGSPHCAGLPSTCGPAENEDCCTSRLVPGGTFHRSYDGVAYTDASFPATVSSFELDRFLVTVGRMRSFASAVQDGWLPSAGWGKHAHVHQGDGLNGGTEAGWDPRWNRSLPNTRAGWDSVLQCDADLQTWTSHPGDNERRPINCVDWAEAYAFCIWDGGFLPTEAEWNYAASGGDEQRVYPWSTPPTSASIDCSSANYNPGSPCFAGLRTVGSSSRGDSRWGQADLVGNGWEWQLDYFAAPFAQGQCTDCADLASGGVRAAHGGTFLDDASVLAVSHRQENAGTAHSPLFSVRCARAPRLQDTAAAPAIAP